MPSGAGIDVSICSACGGPMKNARPESLDGAPGASDGQNVQRYNSGSSSQNLQ